MLAIAKDARLQEKVQPAEVERLLGQWGWMNLVRSGTAAVGGVVGLLTVVSII